jgi:hypothetical protein
MHVAGPVYSVMVACASKAAGEIVGVWAQPLTPAANQASETKAGVKSPFTPRRGLQVILIVFIRHRVMPPLLAPRLPASPTSPLS